MAVIALALASSSACCCGGPVDSNPYPSTGLVLIGLESRAVDARLSIGSDPVAVIVSDDGLTAYIADSAPGDVYAVSLPRGTVSWTTHVGGAPFGLLLDSGRLLVSLFDSATVVELDPAAGKILATHAVPANPATMALDASGRPVVATESGHLAHLDGTATAAGHGYGVALVGGSLWTADYAQSAIIRQQDGMRVPLPLPLHPFWLAPGGSGRLLIAAEGDQEDADPGAVFAYDTATGAFSTLAQPKDPDQVLMYGSTTFVASHGDKEVTLISGGSQSIAMPTASPVALAADGPLDLLVVVVNAHE